MPPGSPSAVTARLYGGLPEGVPKGLARAVSLCEQLRDEGVKVGPRSDGSARAGRVRDGREDFRRRWPRRSQSQEDGASSSDVRPLLFRSSWRRHERGLKETASGGERIDSTSSATDRGGVRRARRGEERLPTRRGGLRGRRVLRRDGWSAAHPRPSTCGQGRDPGQMGGARPGRRAPLEANWPASWTRMTIAPRAPASKPLAEFDRG